MVLPTPVSVAVINKPVLFFTKVNESMLIQPIIIGHLLKIL